MPRILVTGLPAVLQGSEQLRDLLVNALPLAVEGVEGFDISRAHVFAHALADLVEGASVVAFTIEGLLAKPERTAAMRQQLCETVASALAVFLEQVHVPYESIVGWCVQADREEDGFVRRTGPAGTKQ